MKRLLLPLLGVGLALLLAGLAGAQDPPHDSTNSIDCANCHTAHKAPGGSITVVLGNANLCQSCHNSAEGSPAKFLPFDEADQALPGPGLPAGQLPAGTSHRWDSGASGHAEADGANTSTGSVQSGGAFTGRYAKTYTITINSGGDVGTATFDWSDTRGGGATGVVTGSNIALDEGVTATFSDGTTPSFVAGDQWRIYVRTDINQPTLAALAARISDGKIMCSTCHNQHLQVAEPFDSSAPAYGGSGTGAGRHFQRLDNDTNQMCLDCHSARDVQLASGGSHPVAVTIPGTGEYQLPATLPLDKTLGQVQCLSCHQPHYAPTNDGALTRLSNITSLCTECHTLADTVTPASHLDSGSGVLWPGGEYGSDFPQITDTGKTGACTNCHNPHGWPDSAAPAQDYATLLVEQNSENLCYTCHDATGPATSNIYLAFNGATNYQGTADDGALVNQRHDVSPADQTYSGGVVECAHCHDPHKATSAAKVRDPDSPASPYTQVYNKNNTYFYQGANRSYSSDPNNYDPVQPNGAPGGPTIGPAQPHGTNTGNDTAASGGSYSDTVSRTYTVTVDAPGGTPPAVTISVISSDSLDNSGPTTVTAFGTPIAVGSFGVTITFTEGGGIPGTVDPATCEANCQAQWVATSGGTYSGPSDGTYTLEVTTAGGPGVAIIECDSNISGDSCETPTTYAWPGDGIPINLGSYGVTVTIDDNQGQNRLEVGTRWRIDVTAGGPGDGLTANDAWDITVTAGAGPGTEPDYVAFCLTCHDDSAPAGVSMHVDMLDIADAYFGRDQHGDQDGEVGTRVNNGYKKVPWATQAEFDAGQNPAQNYAAIQCTTCHDQHGSNNLFHLKEQITVGGVAMQVGGKPGSEFSGITPTATYTLPLIGGVQQDHYWGAWCTFCHEMSSHPGVGETSQCNTGHKHRGGNF